MVYYYALFPVSLLTFLSIVCLLLFIRRHYLWAGIVGALCGWSFAIGPLIGVALLVAAVDRRSWTGLLAHRREEAGVTFAGFALWLFTNQWVGDWRAYFMGQAKYANGLHDPISVFITAFTGGSSAAFRYRSQSRLRLSDPEGTVSIRRRAGHRPRGVDFATMAGDEDRVGSPELHRGVLALAADRRASLSRYRMEALLVPSVALCTRWPRVVQVVLVGISTVLAVGLTTLLRGINSFERRLLHMLGLGARLTS